MRCVERSILTDRLSAAAAGGEWRQILNERMEIRAAMAARPEMRNPGRPNLECREIEDTRCFLDEMTERT
jgi:hypothetical protein